MGEAHCRNVCQLPSGRRRGARALIVLGPFLTSLASVPGQGPPATQASPDTVSAAAELLAALLGVEPTALTLAGAVKATSPESVSFEALYPDQDRQTGAAVTERVSARVDVAHRWVRSLTWAGRLARPGTPCSLEQAREVAQGFAEKHFVGWDATMRLDAEKTLPLGAYSFEWRRFVAEDVLTGDTAAALVAQGNGLLVSYTQVVALRKSSQAEVQVSREDAIEAATKAFRERLEARAVQPSIESVRLVLSYRHAKDYGPAWFVRLSAGQNGHSGYARELIIVDAATGKEIRVSD